MHAKLIRRTAYALLLFYAVAFGHQVVPHDHGLHDAAGGSCPLCLLLAATVLAVAAVVLSAVAAPVVSCPLTRLSAPARRRTWTPHLRRAPPPTASPA